MTAIDLLTLGTVAVAAMVIVLGVALLWAGAREPEPQRARAYVWRGAVRFSHHRKRCRK